MQLKIFGPYHLTLPNAKTMQLPYPPFLLKNKNTPVYLSTTEFLYLFTPLCTKEYIESKSWRFYSRYTNAFFKSLGIPAGVIKVDEDSPHLIIPKEFNQHHLSTYVEISPVNSCCISLNMAIPCVKDKHMEIESVFPVEMLFYYLQQYLPPVSSEVVTNMLSLLESQDLKNISMATTCLCKSNLRPHYGIIISWLINYYNANIKTGFFKWPWERINTVHAEWLSAGLTGRSNNISCAALPFLMSEESSPYLQTITDKCFNTYLEKYLC